MGLRGCNSDKRGAKLKTETNRNFTISDSAKGACGSSPSPEEGLRSPPPPQGIHRQSKSTKTTSKEAPSDQRDTQASNSEHESCKPSSFILISTEECTQTTNSHEESLRHSTLLMRFPDTLLLPGEERGMPLKPMEPWKGLLQTKKALSHLKMKTVPMGVSNIHHHPKRIPATLFLLRRAQNMLLLSKKERNLPLVPNGSTQLWFLSYEDSSLHQFQKGVQHHSLLDKEITVISYVNQRTWSIFAAPACAAVEHLVENLEPEITNQFIWCRKSRDKFQARESKRAQILHASETHARFSPAADPYALAEGTLSFENGENNLIRHVAQGSAGAFAMADRGLEPLAPRGADAAAEAGIFGRPQRRKLD
uniref:LOW QUALITY PROTEIN: uncharacterized protein LOC117701248 n=1 Tax=Arvicanthis niloticus TaxID=61156 RepID=UPI001485CEF1|nr:LOW QUALITY PROTEIN: uncharacterized protein LOC117701248 [Arvicanthis niloticus]